MRGALALGLVGAVSGGIGACLVRELELLSPALTAAKDAILALEQRAERVDAVDAP